MNLVSDFAKTDTLHLWQAVAFHPKRHPRLGWLARFYQAPSPIGNETPRCLMLDVAMTLSLCRINLTLQFTVRHLDCSFESVTAPVGWTTQNNTMPCCIIRMRASHPIPGRPRKLTLRRIREICSPKVFKLGYEIYEQLDGIFDHVVMTNVDIKRDGTLTGMIVKDKEYLLSEWSISRWRTEAPTSDRVYRMMVSLQTDKWSCTCRYSRVDVCSHVVALLVYAAKHLDVTVPASDLSMQRQSGKPDIISYRDQTLQILAQADGIESANESLTELLKLAAACDKEDDTTQALMVSLGVAEGLLYGLDYQAHSKYFPTVMDRYQWLALESVPESTSMDDLRAYKFGVAASKVRDLYGIRLDYESKTLCLSAVHRMFMMTNPWEPSEFYMSQMILLPRAKKYYEFMRLLHDPLVPTHTPDWRKDPVGFRATLNLAYYQSVLYQELKDPSLLDFYKQHYQDDIGTCIRYIQYLQRKKSKAAQVLKKKCKRLFPNDDPWSDDSVPGLPSIR